MYSPGVMNAADWASVSHLLPLEKHNWGDRNKIDRRTILTVNDLAGALSQDILITCGTTGQHVAGSYHYPSGQQLGVALDIMFPSLGRRDLPDILFEIIRLPFTGIGIYSEWKLDADKPRIGGFHVDFRTVARRALWLRGTAGYERLSFANLQKYFMTLE